jgi:hypothetical protein
VAKLRGTCNKPIPVHSELASTADLEESARRCFSDDGTMEDSRHAHVQSWPAGWEQAAVRVVAEATEYCAKHLVHLSDAVGCLPIIFLID